MPILIKTDSSQADSRWEQMTNVSFEREDELQRLLWTDSAEVIPADASLDESHVVYAREVFTASGPIDLVGIGSSGSVTVMECKLARNQQIKREVVGQVLDYAASLWGTDIESLATSFSNSSGGQNPFEALREKAQANGLSFDEPACRAEVTRRLGEGDFRLLIAVDQIDADLRKIIKYVNSRAGAVGGLKLVALEFRRYAAGSTQVLVPEPFGDELADAARPPRELTEVQQLHFEYWTELQAHQSSRGALVQLNTPKDSIATSRLAPSGFVFSAWNRMNDGWSGVAATAKRPDALERLGRADRAAVTERLSRFGEVQWQGEPGLHAIWVVRNGRLEGMPSDKEQWPKLKDWMAGVFEELWSLFGSPEPQ